METNRHSIVAHRGETFTIDKVLRNKDDTPYIISNELQNPYLLITVSSNEYSQSERIVRNYWLDLKNYPRFTLTQPLNITDIIGWTDDATIDDLSVEINGEYYTITADFAVINNDGEYIYWNDGWVPYECRFIKTFLSDDTKNWPAQRYLYSIQLVYGISNREYLETLADGYGIIYSKNIPADNDWTAPEYLSNVALYRKIVEAGHVFDKNYDPEIPIQSISSISLLSPSDLIITDYPQGGVF